MIGQEDRIPYEALCMKNSIGMCTQLRNEMQVYYTVQSSELTCFKCWSALQLCVFFQSQHSRVWLSNQTYFDILSMDACWMCVFSPGLSELQSF